MIELEGALAYIVEKEGVSDTEYEIKMILSKDEAEVECGDVLYEYETSKTLVEVEAKASGFFYPLYNEDDYIEVGCVIGYLCDSVEVYQKLDKALAEKASSSEANVSEGNVLANESLGFADETKELLLTDSAEELLTKLKLIDSELPSDRYITRADIISLVSSRYFYLPCSAMNSAKKLVFVGAGGVTGMAIEAAREQGEFDIVGILDPYAEVGTLINGVPVIGDESICADLLDSGVEYAIITFGAIGKQHLRQEAYDRFVGYGFKLANIIHPKSIIDRTAVIGQGNLILEGAKIGTQCHIGNNNYINVGSILCHDSVLKGNVHLAPGSIVAGRVTIGKHSLMGMGSTVVSDCLIGDNVIVNNGANVVSNVSNNTIVKAR